MCVVGTKKTRWREGRSLATTYYVGATAVVFSMKEVDVFAYPAALQNKTSQQTDVRTTTKAVARSFVLDVRSPLRQSPTSKNSTSIQRGTRLIHATYADVGLKSTKYRHIRCSVFIYLFLFLGFEEGASPPSFLRRPRRGGSLHPPRCRTPPGGHSYPATRTEARPEPHPRRPHLPSPRLGMVEQRL